MGQCWIESTIIQKFAILWDFHLWIGFMLQHLWVLNRLIA